MDENHFIIIAVAVASVVSIFYIPKKSYRLALVSFLICQVMSWPQPLVLVQIGYTAYPVRDFARATGVNVVALYLFIPMIFAWFMLLFPQNASLPRKAIHYFIFSSITVWFVYFISAYTDLQEYLEGTVLFNIAFLYLRVLVFMLLSHLFIIWFSKKTGVLSGGLDA